jgi:hypothetical protein
MPITLPGWIQFGLKRKRIRTSDLDHRSRNAQQPDGLSLDPGCRWGAPGIFAESARSIPEPRILRIAENQRLRRMPAIRSHQSLLGCSQKGLATFTYASDQVRIPKMEVCVTLA